MFDAEKFGEAMGVMIRKAIEPLQLQIADLKKQLAEKPDFSEVIAAEVKSQVAVLPAPKDGRDCDMDAIKALVDDAVARLPAPKDGKDADMEGVRQMVSNAVAALPVPKDGKSVTLDDVRPLLDDAIAHLRRDADAAIAEPLQLAEKARNKLLEELAALPVPKDGKSVTLDDVAPLIRSEIEKAVAALPMPKDGLGVAGAMIDRDGNLMATLSNGEVKNLGPVVGKDGDDGVSFDAFDLEYLPESHEMAIRATVGTRTKELRYPAGGIRPGGYWREGTNAKAGEAWVHDGSLWIAMKSTGSKPATGNDWVIAARKGRDGERGQKGIDGAPPVPIKLKDAHA